MPRMLILSALITCSTSLSILLADAPALVSVIDRTAPLQEVKTDFQLADGPAWNGGSGLFVPDVKAKQVWFYGSAKNGDSWKLRLPDAGAISGTYYQLGKLYLSNNGTSEIQVVEDGAAAAKTIAKLDPMGKPNDLVVRRDGNLYVTITSKGQVIRVDANGQTSVAIDGVEAPNGITMSPDGQTLYVSLFKSGKIIRARINDDGTLQPPQDFAQLPETEDGFRGDGMCVDRGGNVYCTGADAVHIWSADGEYLEFIKPPSRPINVAFGGTDARTLFIATFGGLVSQRMNAYGVLPKPASKDSDAVKVTYDLVYAQAGPRKLLLDIYEPTRGTAPRPAIVLVHGGGWLNGDRSKFRGMATKLAARGYVVAAIEYRLGFEAKFPAGIQDCNAATRYIRAHATKLGIDPSRIGAIGGSAGGHLVGLMAAAPDKKQLQGQSGNAGVSSHIRAAVVMAGPMKIATGSVADRSHDVSKPSNSVVWIGETIDANPTAYQLADAYESLSDKTPPILFLRGSLDNPDTDKSSIAKLKELGVATASIIHEGARHGHWTQPDWIELVIDDIDRFLKKHL